MSITETLIDLVVMGPGLEEVTPAEVTLETDLPGAMTLKMDLPEAVTLEALRANSA